MEPPPKNPDRDFRPKGFLFANGSAKKPHLHPPTPPPVSPETEEVLYRECMKNHAASLGGYALDGCGEFMPSPAANLVDPASLKCAACGCHRNFHRRLVGRHQHDLAASATPDKDGEEFEDGAPHMLLALSGGVRRRAAGAGKMFKSQSPVAAAPLQLARKRIRTKFSAEQRERMLELSKRIGWRMQGRDEGLVEECCRKIGVGVGVFKVWMHNNKHQLFCSMGYKKGGTGSAAATASGRSAGDGAVEGNHSGDADENEDGHVMNGASSPLELG